MRRVLSLFIFGILVGIALAQQPNGNTSDTQPPAAASTSPANPTAPDDKSSAPDAASATKPQQPTNGATTDQQQTDEKKPSRMQRAKKHLKDQVSEWCVSPFDKCYEKKPKDQDQQAKGDGGSPAAQPQNRPPRSDDPTTTAGGEADGESSSKDTKIDLRPPEGDAAAHSDSDPVDTSDTSEMHLWDPHKAMKNVEVGDYYYSQKNYRAAVSRYQEALQWKANDAIATFKLADAEEKLGNKDAARKNYLAYLKILPSGPKADDAKKALERLK
jgi:tetratricopeptide (TPR) repeat protein